MKNNESLYQMMRCFLELSLHARVKMGMEAREKMEREFDKELVVNESMKIIEENR